jgi:acyl carrier protein
MRRKLQKLRPDNAVLTDEQNDETAISMTKEQIKTNLQELLEKKLPRGVPVKILYEGVPPKNDPDALKLRADLRLTVTALDELATDISEAFDIHFPMDDAEEAATLGDLVTAVYKEISANVGAAAGLALARHIGPMACPECGHVFNKKARAPKSRSKKKPT